MRAVMILAVMTLSGAAYASADMPPLCSQENWNDTERSSTGGWCMIASGDDVFFCHLKRCKAQWDIPKGGLADLRKAH